MVNDSSVFGPPPKQVQRKRHSEHYAGSDLLSDQLPEGVVALSGASMLTITATAAISEGKILLGDSAITTNRQNEPALPKRFFPFRRSQARSLLTMECWSRLSCRCSLRAHLFHKLAHGSQMAR